MKTGDLVKLKNDTRVFVVIKLREMRVLFGPRVCTANVAEIKCDTTEMTVSIELLEVLK